MVTITIVLLYIIIACTVINRKYNFVVFLFYVLELQKEDQINISNSVGLNLLDSNGAKHQIAKRRSIGQIREANTITINGSPKGNESNETAKEHSRMQTDLVERL